MYCKNCGYELPEDAKFCQKCGKAITPLSDNSNLDSPTPEYMNNKASNITDNVQSEKEPKLKKGFSLKRCINRYFNRWKQCKQEKFKGRKNICWTVINAVIIFAIIYNFAMCFYCNRDLNGLTYYRSEDGTYAYAENENRILFFDKYGCYSRPLLGNKIRVKNTVKIGFKTYPVRGVNIWGRIGFFSNVKYFSCDDLDYCFISLHAIPKAISVSINANSILVESYDGHSNLQSLKLKKNLNYCEAKRLGYDSSCFRLGGDYPELTDLQSANVIPEIYTDFAANKLNHVSLELSNGDLSEMMYWHDDRPTEEKLLPDFIYLMEAPDYNINITHTLEDLYGTWIYRDSSGNEVFTVTFQENSYVKINDGLGIIGVDLFTFSEIDNSTLLLKAETEDFWGELISFNMPYELYGKELHLSIYGYELDLVNENWNPFQW